ncbi:MAG TPA: DUF523 domain-containing protein [Clostridia bacterium]|nr:DUF523 domain-containing protein [Clostridia bacterium]
MNILVSACLLGIPCRYDGESAPCDAVLALAKRHHLIPVCPEQLGGLPTPRKPAEIDGGRVKTKDGQDVTPQFERGARIACEIARLCGCTRAVLKQRSPSCGSACIYDGTFSGRLRDGEGITAACLRGHGVCVVDENGVGSLEGGEGTGP